VDHPRHREEAFRFCRLSIVMDVEKRLPVLDADGKPVEGKTEKVVREETLNSMKAIWTQNKKRSPTRSTTNSTATSATTGIPPDPSPPET